MQVARVVIFGKYADIEKPLDYLIPAGASCTVSTLPIAQRLMPRAGPGPGFKKSTGPQ